VVSRPAIANIEQRGRTMARARQTEKDREDHARRVCKALESAYPDAACALLHSDPYQLLVATILSAQCTDARVNMVTPELFRLFPNSVALAKADQAELESLIRSTGFFRAKSRNLLAMAKKVAEDHDGMIPSDLNALTALPGVGRKTANVVLGTAFGIASGVVVDTHVKRLARRLGLSSRATPEQIEQDLMQVVPRAGWVDLSHRLIHHGRRVCLARRPRCEACSLASICPKIGVSAVPTPKKIKKLPQRAAGKRRSGSTSR
jgi:endonuclease III